MLWHLFINSWTPLATTTVPATTLETLGTTSPIAIVQQLLAACRGQSKQLQVPGLQVSAQQKVQQEKPEEEEGEEEEELAKK